VSDEGHDVASQTNDPPLDNPGAVLDLSLGVARRVPLSGRSSMDVGKGCLPDENCHRKHKRGYTHLLLHCWADKKQSVCHGVTLLN
jgi:hypothetical protein